MKVILKRFAVKFCVDPLYKCQKLIGNRLDLVNFLCEKTPKDLVWQAEVLHTHSMFGKQRFTLMIRVDSDEFHSRGIQIPILYAMKKVKSSTLNVHIALPGRKV